MDVRRPPVPRGPKLSGTARIYLSPPAAEHRTSTLNVGARGSKLNYLGVVDAKPMVFGCLLGCRSGPCGAKLKRAGCTRWPSHVQLPCGRVRHGARISSACGHGIRRSQRHGSYIVHCKQTQCTQPFVTGFASSTTLGHASHGRGGRLHTHCTNCYTPLYKVLAIP